MGKEVVSIFLMFFGVLQICRLAASVKNSDTDKSSLLALKAHINSNILAKNWSQETLFCSWIGVGCSRRRARVTSLDLSNMGLEGSIGREIGNLSFLTVLDMSNNSINGQIPTEIGYLGRLRSLHMSFNKLNGHVPQSLGLLKKLEKLNLSSNYLIGDIPTSLYACVHLNILDLSYNNLTGDISRGFIGNLSQLQYLHLSDNQFRGELQSTIFDISSLLSIHVGDNQISGTIPKDICTRRPTTKLEAMVLYSNHFEGEILTTLTHCHSLKKLYLFSNGFTGTIPPSVANLSNLDYFDIRENSFHGTIPPEMGQLFSLTVLSVGFNKLHGEVPVAIFNLSRLWALSVAFNNLSGTLPFSIDRGLPNLKELYVNNNLFHGKIPDSISNLSKLTILELSNNSFSGAMPINLGNLRQIERLNIAINQLSNNMSKPEEDFLSSLSNCKYLEYMQMSGNPITGALPKSLGSSNLSASLVRFRAQNCRITGPLPSELGNLSNLILLHLGGNNLTGRIPETLGSLSSLQRLVTYGNLLHGSISQFLCNLKNLYAVDLSENRFSGELPLCLGNLSMLREVLLSDNAFSSRIPSSIWFNDGLQTMNISNNFLDGSLSQEIKNMKSLVALDLSGNQLSGEIPRTISQLENLITLSLSNNKLDGPIFESFADLKGLQFLDLSHNNLSGTIPNSLEALSYLNYFNVSFNELKGEIPDKGPFANFTAESFKGNKGLCGAPRFNVGLCKERSISDSSVKDKVLKYVLPILTGASILVLIFILVLRRCRKRQSLSSLPDVPPPGFMHIHESITYHEILRATSNLGEENLIGRGSFGSVYRGEFSDARIAAIKVFNLDIQNVMKSFETECQIMSRIRHRNLVKIITSCSNLDFKALVMEYMPNGNLEKWLYSVDCSLNIFQKLGILKDVACALEYLHQGYTFPIVHCDLKPNNILLDEEMVAHVGDFGIAKLLAHDQTMQQTTTLGTFGYMAPEFGAEGLVSTMVDVYSFGILLMEMISSKRPTDKMFSGEVTMKRWVSELFPNAIMQIVDDHELLLDMNDENITASMISVIELALECTSDMPEERPNIKDVHTRISKIKLKLSTSSKRQQKTT